MDKQNVPISLAQGVDTKTDFKQVVVGKLLVLQNGFFQTLQEIRKRFGYDALTNSIEGGGTISSGKGLTTFVDELLEWSGKKLYSLSQV